MSNVSSIQGVTTTPVSHEAPVEPKTEAVVALPTAGSAAAQIYANPSMRLDAALGLVVLEFRNSAGTITDSIPSPRQLEAYRTHQEPSPRQTGQTTEHATPQQIPAQPAPAAKDVHQQSDSSA